LPSGISIDSNDRVIIADEGNHRIQIFDEHLNFIQTFKCRDGNWPYHISIDCNNNIFVLALLSSEVKKIQIYTPMGEYKGEINFSKEKNILKISSFAIHKENRILYALLIFRDEKGKDTSSLYIYDLVTNEILPPYNIQVIKNYTRITYNAINEHIVISNYYSNCIDLLKRENEEILLVKSFSLEGSENGQVTSPEGIIAQGSDIWVVDCGNNRIQKLSLISSR